MDIKCALAALDISATATILAPHWHSSVRSLPDHLPHFLSPETILSTRALAQLPVEADPVLYAAARKIAASPPLLQLAWHCQRLLSEHLDYELTKVRQWPVLSAALGELSGAFYLLVGLATMPVFALYTKN